MANLANCIVIPHEQKQGSSGILCPTGVFWTVMMTLYFWVKLMIFNCFFFPTKKLQFSMWGFFFFFSNSHFSAILSKLLSLLSALNFCSSFIQLCANTETGLGILNETFQKPMKTGVLSCAVWHSSCYTSPPQIKHGSLFQTSTFLRVDVFLLQFAPLIWPWAEVWGIMGGSLNVSAQTVNTVDDCGR